MPEIYFYPNPAQEKFLQAMRPRRLHLFRAGWGTGKTTCGAFVAFRLLMLNPGIRGLVVSHKNKHCKLVLIPKIIEFLEQAGVFLHHHKTDRVITCIVEGMQTQIVYGSADLPDSLDGLDVGWAVGDELRHWPEESFSIFTSRVRDKKARWPATVCLSTPDSNWFRLKFENNPQVIETVASTYANADNIQPNYISDIKASYTDALVKQFIYAEWGGGEGVAFPEFDRTIHVQPDLLERDSRGAALVDVCMDFGGKHAAVFMQHFDWCPRHETVNCFHAVHELMPHDITVEEFGFSVLRELTKHNMKMRYCYPDKAGSYKNYQSGQKDIDILKAVGFPSDRIRYTSDPTVIDIENGVEHMRGMLKPAKGKPRMFFDESLVGSERGIVTAIEGIRKQEGTRKYEKDKNFEHALDCWRYGVCNTENPVNVSWAVH